MVSLIELSVYDSDFIVYLEKNKNLIKYFKEMEKEKKKNQKNMTGYKKYDKWQSSSKGTTGYCKSKIIFKPRCYLTCKISMTKQFESGVYYFGGKKSQVQSEVLLLCVAE